MRYFKDIFRDIRPRFPLTNAEKIFSLLREKYDSDEESTELEIQECKEEEMSLSDWWEWNQDRFCNPEDYNLTENDDEGEPYNWEDGELLKKQVPSYHDFITLLAVDAVRDVFDSNNCLEMSMSGKRLRNQKRMDRNWRVLILKGVLTSKITFSDDISVA